MSTALIPIAPSKHKVPGGYANGCPRADFLAQLIATLEQAPQTRARRRAKPEDAVAAYCASGRRPTLATPALLRSL